MPLKLTSASASGIIPGAGDVADAALNYTLIFKKAQQAELPEWLIRKMLTNNLISAGVGFVPLVRRQLLLHEHPTE
jgi:hypothetical protein